MELALPKRMSSVRICYRTHGSVSLIAVLTLLLAGCAATRPLPPRNQQVARAREALVQRADADSLAAAAMMVHSPTDPSWTTVDPTAALTLVGRAVKLAPQRPDLALLYLQLCMQNAACDPRPLEARLLALDPANGVSWLAALSRAAAASQDAERDRVLVELAKVSRIDFYQNTLHWRLATAAFKTDLVDPYLAFIAVDAGLTRAHVLDFGQVSHACRTDGLQRKEIMSSCRKIAKALQHSDSIFAEYIGDSLTGFLYDQASPEAKSAAQSHRLLDYRISIMQPEYKKADFSAAKTYRDVRRMAKYPREQDSLLAQVHETGKNPDPPPDWTRASQSGAPTPACQRPAGCPSDTITINVSP
jgi:hypothetical protein